MGGRRAAPVYLVTDLYEALIVVISKNLLWSVHVEES